MESYNASYQGNSFEIQLWDTAGQEQYRSLSPIYFRGARAAILVFDVTSKLSFTNLEKWLECLTEVAGDDVFLILVGNKNDLREREVSYPEGREWAQEHNAQYIETSAKTGENISLIFEEVHTLLGKTLLVQNEDVKSLQIEQSSSSCC